MNKLRCPKCSVEGHHPAFDTFSATFSLYYASGNAVITCRACQFYGSLDIFEPAFQESQRGPLITVDTIATTSRLPHRQHPGDAGYDLHANETLTINVGAIKLVRCGFRINIPRGVVGFICPRSGMALKRGVTVLNGPGVIDPGFEDELGVVLINLGDRHFDIAVGDRIAQIVFVETAVVEVVAGRVGGGVETGGAGASGAEAATRRGGFGSSGGFGETAR